MASHDDKPAEALARRQRQLARAQNQRVDNALAELSQSVAGRELLWWLLQIGKVGAQPFTTNALTTAFQCGELNVGNAILERIISVNPAIYVQMQQEHQNEYDSLVARDAADERAGRNSESAFDPDASAGGYDHPDVS